MGGQERRERDGWRLGERNGIAGAAYGAAYGTDSDDDRAAGEYIRRTGDDRWGGCRVAERVAESGRRTAATAIRGCIRARRWNDERAGCERARECVYSERGADRGRILRCAGAGDVLFRPGAGAGGGTRG